MSSHTCPSDCATKNHPGYEHDWWVEAFPVTAHAEEILEAAAPYMHMTNEGDGND